ncbi:MAG: hypothetical protein RIA69_00280 [Cyclobacteriaceae bacterium]
MDDQELFSVWKGMGQNEKRVLNQHEDEFLKIAQSRTNDIFTKIRNNIYWELGISVLCALFFPFLFLNEPVFFWIITALMVVSLGFGLVVYLRYLRDLSALNESSIIESLRKKVNILSRYVKQLYFLMYIFAPIGFVCGFTFSLDMEEIGLTQILIMAAISIPFLVLVIWLGRKYIHLLYGRHLKKIENIYSEMVSENS